MDVKPCLAQSATLPMQSRYQFFLWLSQLKACSDAVI